MQVLLELTSVLHRNVEGQDHWHPYPDMAALEGIERRVGLLSQCQVLGTESRRVRTWAG